MFYILSHIDYYYLYLETMTRASTATATAASKAAKDTKKRGPAGADAKVKLTRKGGRKNRDVEVDETEVQEKEEKISSDRVQYVHDSSQFIFTTNSLKNQMDHKPCVYPSQGTYR